MKRRVLIYGHDNTLLDTRGALVRSAGFDVRSAHTHSEVEKLIKAEPIDALLLCHTVSAEEDEALLLKAKTVQPEMKTLILSANKHNGFVSKDVPTIDIWNGPAAFLKTLRTLLQAPYDRQHHRKELRHCSVCIELRENFVTAKDRHGMSEE